jgi:ABC-2 type transport system ATP-binding protein
MIDVQNLVKTYGTTRAVDNVSFQVKPGEIVGFLGPNGAGKSTTMKILTCFIAPDSGKVSIGGADVLDDPLAVRRRLGYLPENCPVYEDMGVIEFLRFVAAVRNIPAGERKARIQEMVDVCGLAGVAHKTINQLSRGYRQRVGLAQAMVHDPEYLILDEPTSALDPNQIREIRELIIEIGKRKTILLSTHIMQEVAATCTRAIIIARGRVVAQGSVADLTGRNRSTRTYHVEVRCLPKDFESAASRIAGLKELAASAHPTEDGMTTARAVFEGKGEPGEELFALARDKGWILRELREERATLEEVFQRVTTGV